MKKSGIIFFSYLAISFAFFQKGFLGEGVKVIGDMGLEWGGDLQGGLWVEWFLKDCFEKGIAPFKTEIVNYPFGKNLLLSMGNFIPPGFCHPPLLHRSISTSA